ncbi:hypothetical protein C162_26125 [Paenibacillus sp. FSL R7-269]|uniref:hypothetical protein n=1 Tax=Paenibacillus sp. FSL R7-269 TaxID=1226755 RepID=UPI0003E2C595|nr:hypothetical protein [Paenibacillus sp. FSL R7-269]ETT41425.1 hypothetical protein C162_26125 [Paenibacillus sp. FSL R7-269]
MTKYTSRYAELSFYVGGSERKFSGGQYVATSAEEIAVLDRLPDAIKEPADSAVETPEEPVKPAPKPRKAANTSAK